MFEERLFSPLSFFCLKELRMGNGGFSFFPPFFSTTPARVVRNRLPPFFFFARVWNVDYDTSPLFLLFLKQGAKWNPPFSFPFLPGKCSSEGGEGGRNGPFSSLFCHGEEGEKKKVPFSCLTTVKFEKRYERGKEEVLFFFLSPPAIIIRKGREGGPLLSFRGRIR